MPDSGGSRAQREHIPTSGTGPGAAPGAEADGALPTPHGDAGALSVDPAAPAAEAAPALKAARRTGFLVTMVLGG
nr:Bcr/CflA family drug resistance efflux transporter [Streptomyces sp. DSM 41633]